MVPSDSAIETPAGDPARTSQVTMDEAELSPKLDDPQLVEEIRERINLKMADALSRPCSATDTKDCRLLDDVTSWNELLHPVGFEVYEYEPGRFALHSLNAHFEETTGHSEHIQEGAFAFYFLLKTHRCIKVLKMEEHLLLVHCFPLVKLAFLENKGLEVVKVRHSYMAPYPSCELLEAAANITSLRRVVLYELELTTLGAQQLAEVLARNELLESVQLHYDVSDGRDQDVLFRSIAGLRRLSSVSLNSRKLDDAAAKGIAHLLRTTDTLRDLKLGGWETVDPEHFTLVADALNENKTLESVTFSYCYINDEGCGLVASALRENTSIKRLTICRGEFGDGGAQSLAEVLKTDACIEDLDLSGNDIGSMGAGALAEAIAANHTLKNLNLTQNYIDTLGTMAIAKSLVGNTTLEEVNLGYVLCEDSELDGLETMFEGFGIQVSDTESDCLVKLFRKLSSFEKIIAVWNDAGVSELARTIQCSSKIRKVSLEGLCEVSTEVLKELFHALLANKTVETLEIPLEMTCSEDAVSSLTEYLSTTTSLKHFTMPLKASQKEAVRALTEALAVNQSIVHLQVICPDVDELTEQLFGDVFKQNHTIETFLLNDYTGQFELSDHKPLIKLAAALADNYVVTKVKNEFSGVPWEGLSAVHTILRRNRSLLNRAVRFALDPTSDVPEVAHLFWQVRHLRSFQQLLARVVNTTAEEAKDKISVVENFVKCHYGK